MDGLKKGSGMNRFGKREVYLLDVGPMLVLIIQKNKWILLEPLTIQVVKFDFLFWWLPKNNKEMGKLKKF